MKPPVVRCKHCPATIPAADVLRHAVAAHGDLMAPAGPCRYATRWDTKAGTVEVACTRHGHPWRCPGRPAGRQPTRPLHIDSMPTPAVALAAALRQHPGRIVVQHRGDLADRHALSTMCLCRPAVHRPIRRPGLLRRAWVWLTGGAR